MRISIQAAQNDYFPGVEAGAMYLFLRKNKWIINASEEEAYTMMINLADGTMKKPELSAWLKEHSYKSMK